MLRTLLTLFSVAAAIAACAGDRPIEDDSRIVQLSASDDDCDNPIELCLLIEPPQCDTYCADDSSSDTSDCVEDSDGNVTCGDEPCLVLVDADGEEIVSCPGDDCVVTYDAETMTETFECGSGNDADCPNPEPGGGCSEPGHPGESP